MSFYFRQFSLSDDAEARLFYLRHPIIVAAGDYSKDANEVSPTHVPTSITVSASDSEFATLELT